MPPKNNQEPISLYMSRPVFELTDMVMITLLAANTYKAWVYILCMIWTFPIEIEYTELPNLMRISRARLMRLLGRLSGTFLSFLISRDQGVTLGLISYQGYPAIRYWFNTR